MICNYCNREAHYEVYWPLSDLTTYVCTDHIVNARLLCDLIINQSEKGKITPIESENLFPDYDGTAEI